MAKSILQELQEADDMQKLASKMKQSNDTESSRLLMAKVVAKRKKAIRRMGRKQGPARRRTVI